MGQSFFTWNGVDCRSKGILLLSPLPIIRGEERIEHVTIPGRSGELTLTEGERIFQSYIQTANIAVKGGHRIREVINWLTGSGELTTSSEIDKKQQARVIGAITLEKHSRSLDWWEGNVQFYCNPLKEKLAEESETITSIGSSILIEGDVPARIRMTVSCTGDGQGGTADTVITVAGQTLTVVGNSSTTVFISDSDAAIITNATGTTNWTKWSSGDFPILPPGINTFTGSGWSKIIIDKRERFL